jgi:hypothetical protein
MHLVIQSSALEGCYRYQRHDPYSIFRGCKSDPHYSNLDIKRAAVTIISMCPGLNDAFIVSEGSSDGLLLSPLML